MIAKAAIENILEQYKKHGWQLSRVLLTGRLKAALPEPQLLFGNIAIRPSDLDAAWFSRPSRPGTVAWEIRHLSDNPFAFVVGVNDGADAAEREAILLDAEERLRTASKRRPIAH